MALVTLPYATWKTDVQAGWTKYHVALDATSVRALAGTLGTTLSTIARDADHTDWLANYSGSTLVANVDEAQYLIRKAVFADLEPPTAADGTPQVTIAGQIITEVFSYSGNLVDDVTRTQT